ncbi:MAG: hypothetical protein QM638_04490 [Nocardioides sp.]|uniref:hypothetical protein n=1 Tax=Nocardioides sp. TaxID=35761 RepID=UPI0039E62A1A
MVARIRLGGVEVGCGPHPTLLDALTEAGFWMPPACLLGTAGATSLQVVSGETEPAPYTAHTVSTAGCQCQARPLADVEVELRARIGGRVLLVARELAATVVGLERIAPQVCRALLELEDVSAIGTGQRIDLVVPGSGEQRPFTVAGVAGRTVELRVQRVPGGLASDLWLFGSVRLGDRIQVVGPFGAARPPATMLSPAATPPGNRRH